MPGRPYPCRDQLYAHRLSDERNTKAAGLSIGSAANNYLEGADKVTLLTRAGWTGHGLADYDFYWHPRFYIAVPASLAQRVFPWLETWKSTAAEVHQTAVHVLHCINVLMHLYSFFCLGNDLGSHSTSCFAHSSRSASQGGSRHWALPETWKSWRSFWSRTSLTWPVTP
jgi:hypothetical protein